MGRTVLISELTCFRSAHSNMSQLKPLVDNKQALAKTLVYDLEFEQHLIDEGYYPLAYRDGRVALPKPNNQEEILAGPNDSISPSHFSDEDFENFVHVDENAPSGKPILQVIKRIEFGVVDPKCVGGGVPFENLRRLADEPAFPAIPDHCYGARREQLDSNIRTDLSNDIIPSTRNSTPIVPNFFLGVKEPSTNHTVAKREAWYLGLLGARGMHSLQTYGQKKKTYDNNAYTITCLYQMGTLRMFTVHPVAPARQKDPPKYVMHRLAAWSLTGSDAKTYRQAMIAYLNARDLAREWREHFMGEANNDVLNLCN